MTREAFIFMEKAFCGVLEENDTRTLYTFTYAPSYTGPPLSLTLPLQRGPYSWPTFPPFFDGLLPEGAQLEALLRIHKIDRHDYLTQLITVGEDLVGAVTVKGDIVP
ncbi:MAG: HipA N-terminal domain-containing protein [Alphaproteobacteria bacterium]|jgi:serine/threonine-protein kinase HipA